MKRSSLQEKLVALYLRLNGYFTTGLILHSSNDTEVEGEIDIIGVRFCEHRQPDRVIDCSNYLEIPADSKIDIVIGEVKGNKATLQFNKSLRLYPERNLKLFNWIGIIDDSKLDNVITSFMELISPKEIQSPDSFSILRYDNTTIRPILFAPDRPLPNKNQPKYINGQELMDYCWQCFRPERRRESCETDYRAVSNWGEQFEKLVGFFKDKDRHKPECIDELYKHFKIED